MSLRKVLIIGVVFLLGIIVGVVVDLNPSKEKGGNGVLSESIQPPATTEQVAESRQENPVSIKTLRVSKVIDGDTIVLESGEIVRYIGIDAPEKSDCFANEATDENQKLVLGKEVRLEKDVSETDRYQRLLRFVYLGDPSSQSSLGQTIFVNDYLVRGGFAKSYPYKPDLKYQDQFGRAEQEARNSRRGLWGGCDQTAGSSNDNSQYLTPSAGGSDRDCGDFKTHTEAQAFFESQGSGDPHRLDSDGDGIACESLP